MNARQKAFLHKFAELCEIYKPDFFYTKDDDGITIAVEMEDIFTGYDITPEALRAAADKKERL